MLNSLKTIPVGAELFPADDGRTDGRTQTDVTTLAVAFRNFAKRT